MLSPSTSNLLFLAATLLPSALAARRVLSASSLPTYSNVTCFPAAPAPLPILNATNCLYALQNFTQSHISSKPLDDGSFPIVFTSNSSLVHENPAMYLLSPTEVAPDNEPIAGQECGLAFAVYPPSTLRNSPHDVVATESQSLTIAVAEIVGACTSASKGSLGNGGTVSLVPPGYGNGVRIDVTVQRPV